MAIQVKHSKVSTIPDADDNSLVRPSDWNADHTLTGTVPVDNGGTGASTLTGYVKGNGTAAMTASATIPSTDVTGLGSMATQNSNNISVTGGSISGTTVSGYIPTTEKAAALGVATLDAGGTIPLSQIPASIQGGVSYQGTWNASTNTPTLSNGVGTKGYYYVVSVAGNTNLDGITSWNVGDWAIFNGTVWQKVDNTDAVTSVNGFTGTVVLTTTDVAEGTNQYFTTARARTSVSAGTGISYDNATGVITNSSPSLGGDVVGPASATDNAVARYDTTTGKLIQNSLVIIDDTGSVTGVNALTAESLTVNNNATLGSSNTDTLEVNARITTDLEPNTDAAKDIGTSGRNWRDGFFSRNLQAEGKVVSPHFDALNSAGGSLRNSSGTAQLQWGAGGGNNLSVDVAININPANAQVAISPTGTGSVAINPATAGTMNNMVIGGTTPLAGSFTDLSVSGTTSFDGQQGTAGQVLTSAGTGNTPTWTTPTTGTVTSVTGTAPVVSSGGATPAISMAAATGSVDGYLTSTDWTTFNNKSNTNGTVTSVAATVPSFLSVSGSPVTTSGTLALSYSGTALPTANGGTGLTSFTANGLLYASSTSALTTGSALVYSAGTDTLTAGTFAASNGAPAINIINQGTGAARFNLTNSGGTAYIGLDNSGGGLTVPYALNLYHAGAYPICFSTNNAEKMRIFSSGGVSIGNTTDAGAGNLNVNGTGKFGTTVGVGAATPSTSGAGITFPATQSASTDPNTLDDYEEGTFVPTDASGEGLTFTSAYGAYTKIGRMVFAQINIAYPVTANTANSLVGSLPFTVNTGSNVTGRSGGYISLTDSTAVGILLLESSTTFRIYNASFVQATNANLSGKTFYIALTYIV
jgi:hypothetical protein